jgi:hypothetical protein
MWSPRLLATLGAVAAMTLMAPAGVASTSGASRPDGETRQLRAEPTRTGKERLGGKASDEQRVDNCKVPLELRGPNPRPDDCAAIQPTESGASRAPAEQLQPASPAQSR